MSGARLFRIGLWVVVALFAGAAAALWLLRPAENAASVSRFGSPFQLVDQNGATVTDASLRGKPSAMFFGFTHCPDVCPTTLYELNAYQKAVRDKGGDFRIVLVTVDPERDTPEVLKSYIAPVAPDATALTGDPAAVASMLKGWGIYAAKVGEGADYAMDHTATTLLLDADGALAGTIAYGENPETAQAKLNKLTGV